MNYCVKLDQDTGSVSHLIIAERSSFMMILFETPSKLLVGDIMELRIRKNVVGKSSDR